MNNKMTFRDVEKLSAYLDGQLSQADVARLESRLAQDPELRAVMDDLRRTRAVLRAAPKRRAPRNFTLKAQGQRVRPPVPRTVPALRFASALASLLLVITFVTNFVAPIAANRNAQPLYGFGGGGGGDTEMQSQYNAEPGAPVAEMPAEAAPAPTSEPEMVAPAAPAPTGEPTEEPTLKSQTDQVNATQEAAPDERGGGAALEPEPVPVPESRPPIAIAWQLGLLVAAAVLAALAYGLRWLNDKNWAKRK